MNLKPTKLSYDFALPENGKPSDKFKPNFTKTIKEWSNELNRMDESFFEKTTILTTDSHKISVSNQTQKGVYKSSIVYMLQGELSGHEVCPYKTKSCSDNCLGTNSGHSALVKKGNNTNAVQISRMRKSIMFAKFRDLFSKKLFKELSKFEEKAIKEGVKPAFRFNGTSDVQFHKLKVPFYVNKLNSKGILKRKKPTFIEYFKNIEFYDYSKSKAKMLRFLSGKFPKNYSVVYSFTPEMEQDAQEILSMGGNVAVAFAEKSSKKHGPTFVGKSFLNHEIVNSDQHDLRFVEYAEGKRGVVLGLTAKGNGWKKDETGFFVDVKRVR